MTKINMGGQQTLVSEGAQEARIARIIELGQQPQDPNSKFKKETTPFTVLFMFELMNDKVTIEGEEKPASISSWISLPVNSGSNELRLSEKSNMYKVLLAAGINPKNGVDLKSLINKPIQLTIVHRQVKGQTKAYIATYSGVSKTALKHMPPLVMDAYFFDWNDPDPNILGRMSTKMRDLLKKAENYKGSEVQKLLEMDASFEDTV